MGRASKKTGGWEVLVIAIGVERSAFLAFKTGSLPFKF
jgi:hypothetical protein